MTGCAATARRLVGLAVLGVLHAVFFFIADILFSYALLGIGLLFFVSRSNRTALWGAAAAFTGGILLLVELVLSARATPENGLVGTDPTVLDAALRGGFLDAAVGRIEVIPEVFVAFGVLNCSRRSRCSCSGWSPAGSGSWPAPRTTPGSGRACSSSPP